MLRKAACSVPASPSDWHKQPGFARTTTPSPIFSATDEGEISADPMTDKQKQILEDALLEYFQPEAYAELITSRTNREQIKANYTSAIDRLEQIQLAANPTNAQVIAAVKDLAKIQEQLLKFLRIQLFG